ncbi:MAG: hypothetical protein FD160_1702 [Caulobacteraceae bacterium]|nr:MAG: hypothetical protein FD160_1702 [Caulobacteraceae bacterium]
MELWDPAKTYLLEDGDGFPWFMHLKHKLRVTEEPWFSGYARGQPAKLFVVLGPEHAGRYVALESRLTATLEVQMSFCGVASVVVNLVENPTTTYGQNPMQDVIAVGMTVLRHVDDPRFS